MRFLLVLLTIMTLACSGAHACMSTQSKEEIVEGRLSLRAFKDGMGRRETAYIITMPKPGCLDDRDEPENNVKSARTVHIFSSKPAVERRIRRFVGKFVHVRGTVFAAHTVHHHAPIVMDIAEIDEI